jgi:hypothetical protein
MNTPPRIEEVTSPGPATLLIRWTTGETMEADIGDWMNRFVLLSPLKDPAPRSSWQLDRNGVQAAGDHLVLSVPTGASSPNSTGLPSCQITA